MAGNMLTAYDITQAGTQGSQDAISIAAQGDALQTARIQNRLARMVAETGIDEQAKNAQWQQNVTNMLTNAPVPPQQAPTAPAAPTAPPVAAPPQPPVDPRMALANSGLQNDMVKNGLMTPPAPAPPQAPAAPAQPPAATATPPQPTDPYDQLFKATQPGGQLYMQDPQRAIKLNDEIKVKRSTEQWDKLQNAIQEGKVSVEQQKDLQTKFEPVVRAMVPLTQEYEKQIAKGVSPEKALAAVQPAYQQLLKDMSQVPGFEQAAKMAPTTFSPKLAYTMADTFKSMEATHNIEGKENAKLDEQKRSGFNTPDGKIIFTNGKGQQFVDGKEYHGKAVKPKVGMTGGAGNPSEGQIAHADAKGKQDLALQYRVEWMLNHGGEMPKNLGRDKNTAAMNNKAMALFQQTIADAGLTQAQVMAAGADIKATVGAMVKQKNLIANTDINAAQAEKNIKQLRGLYDKLGNGTIPMLNSVANRFAKHLGAPEPGTAEAVAYETMIEYTKVVTGQTTGAAPTDSAMKNTNDLIDVLKDNPTQINQKFDNMITLMENKKKSQAEGYNNLKASLSQGVQIGGSTPAAPATAPSGGKRPLSEY